MRRNNILAVGLCVTLALLMTSEILAATYYVAPSGNDSNSGTVASSALRTIKRAASLARSGDRVLVSAGEYADSFNIVGKQGSGQLQFVASQPGSVIISGQINVVDSNGLVFSNLKFAGNADRFLTWQGSYDGTLSRCEFLRGRNALLIKSGSLTIDDCTLSDFVSDGIEVDGTAKLLVSNSRILGCQGSAIKILKNARVAVDGSNISDNVGDGVRVAVTTDSIPVTSGGCDCTGTTPQSMKREAYDLLAGVNPQTGAYRQAIDDARNAILSSLTSTLWQDEWTATVAGGQTVYERSHSAIEILEAVYSDNIDFFISGDEVVVNQPFKLNVKVLGAAISTSSYDVPVTTSFKVDSDGYEPWGKHGQPVGGNVNDNQNPRSFETTKTHAAGSRIKVKATSWVKVNTSYSGSENEHWREYMTVTSNSNSANLIVLRDGDAVPNLAGFGGQASAASFLASYIEDGRIVLDKNQAIFLFELGTTNLSSSAADFQDLVVLITMRANHTAVTSEEADLIMRAIILLLESDKNLASCAINQAVCASGNADAIAEAESFFNKALREGAAEHFVQATQDYRTAWEAAQKALANASGSSTVSSTSPNPPAGWTGIDMPIVTVSTSTLTGNNSGVAIFTVGSFVARNSDFSNNKQWGTRLRGDVDLDSCTINTNGVAGVWLEDGSTATVFVHNLTVKDNVEHGLFVKNCNLNFDSGFASKWSISGSEVVIAGEGGDLSFNNAEIAGGSTAAVSVVDCDMNADDSTFSGSGYGVSATDSNISLYNCTLSDNTVGLHADQNKSLSVQNSKIYDNVEWGVKLSGPGSFVETTISDNGIGGLEVTNGQATVNDCVLSGNDIGLFSDGGCLASGSKFTGNTTTGASVLGSATFTNCVFEQNPNGLQITNDTTGLVNLVGSQIKDNTDYGVWCDACTLTFDTTMQADWSVQNNGSNFGATGSALTFSGFTISNGTTYGVVSENGTLNLINSTLTSNGTGAYIDANSTLTASGSKFTGNTLYGASIRGKASLANCSLDHNTHGLQIVNMTAGNFTSSGTIASDNTEAGLHVDSSTLTLTGDGLTLADNQYGIYSTNSTLVFDDFASRSNTYGAWLTSSNVTITNSSFTDSTYGLWATNNNSLSVGSSTFSGNSSYGVYLEGNGSIHNCSITGNESGLYLNTTDATDATLTGTNISGNTLYGVYSYNASLALTSQATEGWSIDSNGYNVAGYQADISLLGAKMTDATHYGVMAQYGSLNLQQSTITSKSNGVGGFNTNRFDVDRSHISGSSTGSWGVVDNEGGLTMRNTVVSGAQSGVYSDSSKPVIVYNSTIADASLNGLQVERGNLTVINTIISGTGGTYGLYRGPSANLTHSYNLISGFTVPFENTTADPTEVLDPPRFADAANGDFSLAKGSPAINAGTNMSIDVPIDVLGNPRPSRQVSEIGAYEYMPAGGSLRVLNWKEER